VIISSSALYRRQGDFPHRRQRCRAMLGIWPGSFLRPDFFGRVNFSVLIFLKPKVFALRFFGAARFLRLFFFNRGSFRVQIFLSPQRFALQIFLP